MTIDALDVLVGSWDITGRSAGSPVDDISGTLTATPILGGTVLQMTGTMRTGGHTIDALELVWPDGDGFAAHVYSAGGTPIPYRWARTGPSSLMHAGSGATYHGTISDDGATIAGAWRADPGQPDNPEANYTAVMRRVG